MKLIAGLKKFWTKKILRRKYIKLKPDPDFDEWFEAYCKQEELTPKQLWRMINDDLEKICGEVRKEMQEEQMSNFGGRIS